MAVVEHTDRARIAGLLADDPLAMLEARDECALGVDGIVTVFAEDLERPANLAVVRWAQASAGLRHAVRLRATRLLGLEDVVRAIPASAGQYEVGLPFWASPAVSAVWKAEVSGADAIYRLDADRLVPSPVVRQCTRIDDLDVVRPMFRKLAVDTPAYVLSLRGELAAVAVVTHLREGFARLSAYTVESARGRGFARGALTALADELLALKIVPTAMVDLGQEAQVRMVEDAGFHQHTAYLRARLEGRRVAAPGLVQLAGAMKRLGLIVPALLVVAGCPRGSLGWLEPPPDGAEIECPVTRKRCAKTPDSESAIYESRTYYFCAPEGAARFGADPARYADR